MSRSLAVVNNRQYHRGSKGMDLVYYVRKATRRRNLN